MSNKTFIILLVVLGLLYIASAGIGLIPGKDQSLSEAFNDKFGWLKPETATVEEIECEPDRVFRRDNMVLVFTESDDSCTLAVSPKEAGESRSLKLTCPDGVTLTITAPNAETGKPEKKELPAEHEGKKYSDASFKLKAGESVQVECTVPADVDEIRVPIGG